jgi:hypothetical protein
LVSSRSPSARRPVTTASLQTSKKARACNIRNEVDSNHYSLVGRHRPGYGNGGLLLSGYVATETTGASSPRVDYFMRANTTPNQVPQLQIPPTSELFSKEALVERHPNLLTHPRLQWALRNRATNGLSSAVYESKSGKLLVHEPGFLRWYLGLTGRSKPRASRIRLRGADSRGVERF